MSNPDPTADLVEYTDDVLQTAADEYKKAVQDYLDKQSILTNELLEAIDKIYES